MSPTLSKSDKVTNTRDRPVMCLCSFDSHFLARWAGTLVAMMMMKLPILPCTEKLELVLTTAPKT